MSGEGAAIRVRGLTKVYRHDNPFKKNTEPALRSVDLEVPGRQAFGLLGLNGAGKTTLVKVILGLLRPTEGTVEVLGGDIRERAVRQKVGYLPELPYFPKTLTARELLTHFGRLYGLRGAALAKRVEGILETVRLTRAADHRIAEYSKGMQQRVGLGQAILGEPELLLCDEPVSGLDPVGYKEVRDIFLELKKTGTTLFFNTHVLSEVEKICDWVGVLHEGTLRRVARVSDVLSSETELDYWVEVSAAWEGRLEGLAIRESVARSNGFRVTGGELARTLGEMEKRGVKTEGVRPLSSLVEHFFLSTIGRENDLMYRDKKEVHA